MLRVVVRGIRPEDYARLSRIAKKSFNRDASARAGVYYVAALFRVDPRGALRILTSKLSRLGPVHRLPILNSFLSLSFSDLAPEYGNRQEEIPAEVLAQLVRLTFWVPDALAETAPTGGIRPVDGAEYARSALLTRFLNTPGEATYRALLDFQEDPNCPIPSSRLRSMARKRALQDSDSEPWLPGEAEQFEDRHEGAPRTAADLQTLVLSRIEDMQHDLVHGDFGQGRVLQVLKNEVDVQNWLADRLRLTQRQSYSVERESHVADEKEPDIRIRAKSTDANVAVEVKLAEDWTLKQLEEALTRQLCGQYLRARGGRHGLLLLVHKTARPRGWRDAKTRRYHTFAEVHDRLSRLATRIRSQGMDAPQPLVAMIDVSGMSSASGRERNGAKRQRA
jgi:hypothetical protein